MGLINWYMHRSMKNMAKDMAKDVAKRYPKLKVQNPNYTEVEIIKKLINSDLSKVSEKCREDVQICCASIEGYCYMMSIGAGPMKGSPVFRCLQFTRYMDDELYARGFKQQSKQTKETVLERLNLLVGDWEKWCDEMYADEQKE